VLPSCATSRGHSPIRNLGTRVAAVVPQHASQSLTQADTTKADTTKWAYSMFPAYLVKARNSSFNTRSSILD